MRRLIVRSYLASDYTLVRLVACGVAADDDYLQSAEASRAPIANYLCTNQYHAPLIGSARSSRLGRQEQ